MREVTSLGDFVQGLEDWMCLGSDSVLPRGAQKDVTKPAQIPAAGARSETFLFQAA